MSFASTPLTMSTSSPRRTAVGPRFASSRVAEPKPPLKNTRCTVGRATPAVAPPAKTSASGPNATAASSCAREHEANARRHRSRSGSRWRGRRRCPLEAPRGAGRRRQRARARARRGTCRRCARRRRRRGVNVQLPGGGGDAVEPRAELVRVERVEACVQLEEHVVRDVFRPGLAARGEAQRPAEDLVAVFPIERVEARHPRWREGNRVGGGSRVVVGAGVWAVLDFGEPLASSKKVKLGRRFATTDLQDYRLVLFDVSPHAARPAPACE